MSADPRCVKDLDDLKAIIKKLGGSGEFYIMLAGGQFRSAKTMKHDPSTGAWGVFNHIDDTEQDFGDDQALLSPDNSMIGEALEKNAFVWKGN